MLCPHERLVLKTVSPSFTLGRGLFNVDPIEDVSVVITQNEMVGIHEDAIALRDARKVLIQENDIRNAPERGSGIALLYASDVQIFDNHIEQANIGIDGAGKSGLEIVRNQILKNVFIGISGAGGGATIRDNEIRENGVGIEWTGSELQLEKNVITENRVGLKLIISPMQQAKIQEALSQLACKGNQIFANVVDFAGLLNEPLDELRQKCEGQ